MQQRVITRFVIPLLVILSGCSKQPSGITGSANRPFHGQSVKLAVPASQAIPAHWEVMIQEWSAQSGATAAFQEYDPTAPSISDQLSNDESVVLFPLQQLMELDSRLNNLASINELDSRDLFKGMRERVLTHDQQLMAFPVSAPCLVCYYRSDLLKAAGKKPPETWSDYEELAKTVDDWAKGLVAVEPLSAEFRATTFFARALAFTKHPENYSVWFDSDTGKPVLDTPGFAKALEVSQQVWATLPAEVLNYGPMDCRRLMLTGKAAITLSYETGKAGGAFLESETSTPVERIDGIQLGICPLPGSKTVYNRNSKRWDSLPGKSVNAPALCGFSGLALGIIADSKKPAETTAANLLASLCSPEMFDQAFAFLPKGPCRESQIIHAAGWFTPELSTEESSEYCDAVSRSLREKQIVFELPVAGASEFKRVASQELEHLFRKEASIEQTIAAIQKAFETIVENRGPEAVLASHRRGLGLAPALKKSAAH